MDQAIRELLTTVGGNVTGLSCLADGADQLFTRAVLDHGGTIEVIVPARQYRDSLPEEAHGEYDRILSAARKVHRMDFTESDSEAHMAASAFMLDQADELWAVWDGKPARGYGGTADVVAYARQRHIPVRDLMVKAEHGGPLVKAALAGAKALVAGKSPVRALLSFGWTAFKETLAKIFGRGRRGRPTNLVEQIDVGAPRRLVYDQWTQFQDYPSFMKKVESVEQADDTKLNWKAKIFWSARTWESTIVEQVPDEHIVWRSKGPKGHVDGTVSFHELAPNLTRVLLVLEYHPQGFFERTGNLWRPGTPSPP